MTFGTIVLLSIGLAMDATAVAAARGMSLPVVRVRHAALVALFFGGSQALMPLGGWLLGARFGSHVQRWDHWIAFGLLGVLGAKMLWEARGEADAPAPSTPEPLALTVLFGLAIATSIDALAVGFTLPVLGAPLVLSLATIGVTTALLSSAGLYAGRRFGALFGKRLDAIGGFVLIGLGTKILIEHLASGT